MCWPEFAMVCAVANFGEIKMSAVCLMCGDKTGLIGRFAVQEQMAFCINAIELGSLINDWDNFLEFVFSCMGIIWYVCNKSIYKNSR
jgi:hypothetical protein